jgi:hypothetical protein
MSMDANLNKSPRVALVWRGDRQARDAATAQSSRQAAVFAALSAAGLSPEPCVYAEEFADEVRAQLLDMDAVLVWVDPISGGRRRLELDELLREVAKAGVLVSAHPDVIARMGVKSVLYRTRGLGWGCDTYLYKTARAFEAEFPARLAGSGPRVLKQDRGNGGIGVWKVERLGAGAARVTEARSGAEPRVLPLKDFLVERRADFQTGPLIDQAYQSRLPEGMIRCYMSGARVAGFGRQIIRGLMPPQAGPAGPRIMSGPDYPPFQALRTQMETKWTPGLSRLLSLRAADLPVIWDADFLLGAPAPDGQDTYVLCEINVSSVFPIPDDAPAEIARTLSERLTQFRGRSGHGRQG